MFVQRVVRPRQHPSAAESDRRPIACPRLARHVIRRLLGRRREIEMPGRLVAPDAYRSVEVRVRGAAVCGISKARVGPQPKTQRRTIRIGLAVGQRNRSRQVGAVCEHGQECQGCEL